jgi:hypothetical protein
VYNGVARLSYDKTIKESDYLDKSGVLNRGDYPPIQSSSGEVKIKDEFGIIFQTIGKIKWKGEFGLKMKVISDNVFQGKNESYPSNVWDLSNALVKNSYPEKLDIGLNYYPNSSEEYTKEASKINSFADDLNKVNNINDYVPLMFISDYELAPKNIQIVENVPLASNIHEAGINKLIKPYCGVDPSINSGHLTVILAKKYNSKYLNADILYKYLIFLDDEYTGYKYSKSKDYFCYTLLKKYLDLFSSSEIKEIVEHNMKYREEQFIRYSKEYSYLNEYVHYPFISRLKKYSINGSSPTEFIEHLNKVNAYYDKSMVFWENGVIDSIINDRLVLRDISKEYDSLAYLLNQDYNTLSNNYNNLINNFRINSKNYNFDSTLKSIQIPAERIDKCNLSFERFDDLKKRILFIKKDKSLNGIYLKGNGLENNNTLLTKLDQVDSIRKKSMNLYSTSLSKYNEAVKNLNQFMGTKKGDKINAFIDNILSLPVGSVMRFTPYMLDYIDERNDRTTALTSPIVIVKKVNNVDRKTVLVQVLQMPIPDGFNSNNMRVEYSLKIGAEVLLPISEFEGYPGNSSSNQMLDLIDSLK